MIISKSPTAFLRSLICRLGMLWALAHWQIVMRIKWTFVFASIKDSEMEFSLLPFSTANTTTPAPITMVVTLIAIIIIAVVLF